jgi:hypothetical protein
MTVPGKLKVVQYLVEAHTAEQAWAGLLKGDIAITPSGAYRTILEKQRTLSARHAADTADRLAVLGGGGGRHNLIGEGVSFVTGAVSQAVAIGRAPLALLRGGGGEDKLVHNVIEELGVLEHSISLFRALAAVAGAVDDEPTASLASSAADAKQEGLDALRDALPGLVASMIRADVQGKSSYDIAKTGIVQQAEQVVEDGKEALSDAADEVRSQAQKVRRVPGVTQVEGAVKGALADEDDLAIANYDTLTAEEVISHLGGLSQIDLAKIGAYETKNAGRSTVLHKVTSLIGSEPWPGYDDQTVVEIRKALASADSTVVNEVKNYERRHKDRTGVLDAVESALVP